LRGKKRKIEDIEKEAVGQEIDPESLITLAKKQRKSKEERLESVYVSKKRERERKREKERGKRK